MSNFVFRIGETEDGKAVKMDLQVLIATRFGIIANSGGGKSYALRVLVERTGAHVQWILLDMGGEFASLRKMFPDMLLVGAEGELPVDVRSANLLARKIMETHVSAIVDLYGLRKIRAAWTANFLNVLNTLPKTLQAPVLIAVDEAHLVAPETPSGTKEERENLMRSREQVVTLADSGRKEMRGSVILSQRVSKLATDARAELRNRFVGLAVQDLDRDRAADDLGMSKRDALVLRDLGAGEFYAFGPAFLNKGIFKMRVDKAETPHPNPGEHRLLKVPPAGDALKQIVLQLGDLPQQAEEEVRTLEQLQKENARLTYELNRMQTHPPRPTQMQMAAPRVETKIEYVDRPVLNGEVKEFVASANALRETLVEFPTRLSAMLTPTIKPVSDSLGLVLARVEQVQAWKPAPQTNGAREFVRVPNPPRAYATAPKPAQVGTPQEGDSFLVGGVKKVLDTLVDYPDGVEKDELLVMTGYRKTSVGEFTRQLLQRGYAVAQGKLIVATSEGIDAAYRTGHQPLPKGDELRAYWLNKLTGGPKVVLQVLVDVYPQWVEKAALLEMVPYKKTSIGEFTRQLIACRVVQGQGTAVRASELLFG